MSLGASENPGRDGSGRWTVMGSLQLRKGKEDERQPTTEDDTDHIDASKKAAKVKK